MLRAHLFAHCGEMWSVSSVLKWFGEVRFSVRTKNKFRRGRTLTPASPAGKGCHVVRRPETRRAFLVVRFALCSKKCFHPAKIQKCPPKHPHFGCWSGAPPLSLGNRPRPAPHSGSPPLRPLDFPSDSPGRKLLAFSSCLPVLSCFSSLHLFFLKYN